ncbi:iron-regulated membrane protein [Klebsiella pneumoniae subsp. ozaenae]|uniref:Iron-regulated membrane protein n=1 Tax=Klebsiella pneumoniae subsp. ozaenae TaxID=574 RepID=A0A378AD47_KLEPO|nr:iron-regulated membrane protein [Klebsiella pneumoniae subsp. ozaenae]
MAKLTRWGVDFHMGILFGLANQLLLVGFGCALCVTIGVGYRLWWIRRPPQAAWDPAHSLLQAWLSLAWPARSLVLGLAFALGLAMPLMEPACCCSLPLTTCAARGNGNEDDEVQRLSEDLRRADDHRYPAVFGAPGRRVVAGDRVFFAKAAGD